MSTINPKRYNYLLILRDTFMEGSDNVAQTFAETEREGRSEDHKKYYYGVLSLDQSEGLENHAESFGPSPEDILVQEANAVEYELLLSHLYEDIG